MHACYFRLHNFSVGMRPFFRSSLEREAVIFSHLHIVACVQLSSVYRRVTWSSNSFPVFYLASTALTAFSFAFIPANQKTSICCRSISTFNPNYITPLLPDWRCLGELVLIRVICIDQIDLSENYSYSVRLYEKEPS